MPILSSSAPTRPCRALLFFAFFITLCPLSAIASEVIVNEIAWMGSEVSGVESKNWWRYEWLELYNPADSQISLDGWKIELYRTDLDWTLLLKGNILANGYFLIVSSDRIFPNYGLNYANLNGKLNNNGQKILLKNNFGDIVDEIDCFSFGKWFAGDNATKQTMERKNAQSAGNNADNWQKSQASGGTPNSPNSNSQIITISNPSPEILSENEPASPQPSIIETQNEPVLEKTHPSGVFINEILPSPEGPDETNEWIEVFNQNDFEVNLSGWKLVDVAGQTKIYTFSENAKIIPKGFLTLFRPITNITLNNEGDGLKLLWPDNSVADTINYEKAPTNQSFNKTETGWFWSESLTPGSKNITKNRGTESKTLKENEGGKKEMFSLEKGLAAVGTQWPRKNYILLLVAFFMAFFSATIILILKRKTKKD